MCKLVDMATLKIKQITGLWEIKKKKVYDKKKKKKDQKKVLKLKKFNFLEEIP